MGLNLHSAGLVKLNKGTYVTSGRKEAFEIMLSLANNCLGLESTNFEKKKSHQKIVLGYFAKRYRSRLRKLSDSNDELRNSFLSALTRAEVPKNWPTEENLNKLFQNLGVLQSAQIIEEFRQSKKFFMHTKNAPLL